MTYTVLSIDPGTNSFGYAFSQVTDNNFEVFEHNTLYPSAYPKESRYRKDHKWYSDRVLCGKVIGRTIRELVMMYKPDYIASEDAFYNPSRPNAFISLLIAIYAMESTLHGMYEEGILIDPVTARVFKTPPTLIKKVMSHELGGKATKDDMTTALNCRVQQKEITFRGFKVGKMPDSALFTEHSIDAISIGFTFSKLWKPMLDAKVLEPRMTSFTKTVKKLLKKCKYKSPYLT
jgi:hypothetical protein